MKVGFYLTLLVMNITVCISNYTSQWDVLLNGIAIGSLTIGLLTELNK